MSHKSGHVIIDLVDDDSNCKSHWGERRKWYVSRKGVIKHYYRMYPDEKPKKFVPEDASLRPKRLASAA